MMFNRSSKKKMSFERFLTCEYARDYIDQNTPYTDQIEKAARAIRKADYVLLGAGAGMSVAAGAQQKNPAAVRAVGVYRVDDPDFCERSGLCRFRQGTSRQPFQTPA